jgi:hypothetical protein
VTVDVAVMAHPARAEQAEKLAAQIDAPITWDNGSGEWDTGQRAWASLADSPAPWAALVQDDALPIDGFRQHLEDVAAAMPVRTACSLYVGTGRPRAAAVTAAVARADSIGASWLECDGLLWGVAIMLPTEHITPMLDWAQSSPLPYDQRISHWYRTHGMRVRHCWPSIVDHADGPRLTNTGGTPTAARHAHRIGPPNTGGPVVTI